MLLDTRQSRPGLLALAYDPNKTAHGSTEIKSTNFEQMEWLWKEHTQIFSF